MKTGIGVSTAKGFIEIVREENGVLKIGDAVIPQRKLLSDTVMNITGSTEIYNDTNSIEGRTFEIYFYSPLNRSANNGSFKFTTVRDRDDDNSLYFHNIRYLDTNVNNDLVSIGTMVIRCDLDTKRILAWCYTIVINMTTQTIEKHSDPAISVTKVYEIIE